MRKRQRSEHDLEVRKDAEEYGLGRSSQPIDLLTILAKPRRLKARLESKEMAGESDYGICQMSLEKGELLLHYRPDVTLIGELRSQWHEVREAMLMLRRQDTGAPHDGKPRHRGMSNDPHEGAPHDGKPRHRGMFNDPHELDVEGWATAMTLLCLFGDEAPDAEDAGLGNAPSYDSMLEELDS